MCVCVAKPVAVELRCHATALISFFFCQAKRKNMCVSCYISQKIRVGRSLLIFFFIIIFFFIFPDFTKKTKQMRCLHEVYNEKGLFT